ncbi:MAG: 5-formyltetrahydrofolate cyclo-ligase [Bdellovibrio sp.]|jgi:5-formyltetrahydrofolate cyclo-ligase
MSVQDQKSKLRQELKLRLRSVTEAQQSSLRSHLNNWLTQQSGTWAVFAGLQGEPDLKPLLDSLTHLTWVFPRIKGQDLIFHQVTAQDLEPGSFGILEPRAHHPRIEKKEIQGFLIPGLGFDRQGYRLGRGKGFYDRVLAEAVGFKLGVGFECQWTPAVPVESHDQKLHAIMTDAGLWTCAGI